MTNKKYNILFLCTGNSARSIMCEVLINQLAGNRFKGFSAGSFPKEDVHLLTLKLLNSLELPTDSLRSKSWDEFIGPSALAMDFVITVCDRAADETCPIWPGGPVTAHWSIADPAAAEGGEAERVQAFRSTFERLRHRIRRFVALDFTDTGRTGLQQKIAAIGQL